MLTYYCWNCYGLNPRPSGPCVRCGHEVEPPPEADLLNRLLWATRHPNPDVAVMAVRRLGIQGDAATAEALRELLEDPPDPYIAAEALRSLVQLLGADELGELLRRLADNGPVPVRAQARRALARPSGGVTEDE